LIDGCGTRSYRAQRVCETSRVQQNTTLFDQGDADRWHAAALALLIKSGDYVLELALNGFCSDQRRQEDGQSYPDHD
jgi:lipid A disaccharide synthetase